MSLIDSFGRNHTYLRISITDRCNLRCIYCMPPEGVELKKREEILNFDEITRLVRLFAELGVKKIRLTGGEPSVRKDLPDLVSRLARIPGIENIGMTTNGVVLEKHIQALKNAGLNLLNISLDTFRHERFLRIALRDYFTDVMKGIYTALELGFIPLKINTVVMKGINDDEILDFVEFVKDKPINIRFIEYMPFRSNQWSMNLFMSYFEMLQLIEKRYPITPIPATDPAPVAKDYSIPGFQGTISFITSMSEHFCDTCNRVRLTADGFIKPCLFDPLEMNIRELLRDGTSDDKIKEIICNTVAQKSAGHAPMEEINSQDNRAMVQIGG